jgi:hypothetical protein
MLLGNQFSVVATTEQESQDDKRQRQPEQPGGASPFQVSHTLEAFVQHVCFPSKVSFVSPSLFLLSVSFLVLLAR